MVRRVLSQEEELEILRESLLSTPRSLLVHAVHSRGNATKEEIAASNKLSIEELDNLLEAGKAMEQNGDPFNMSEFSQNAIADIISQPGINEVQYVWLVRSVNLSDEYARDDDIEWHVLPETVAAWIEDMMVNYLSRIQHLRSKATEQDPPAHITISPFYRLGTSAIQNWS